MDSKASIRKQIRQLKTEQSKETRQRESVKVFNELSQLEKFASSKVILAYWDMEDEVQINNFIEEWHRRKTILLPVIQGNHLVLKKYEGVSSLEENKHFKVLEPTGENYTDLEKIDLIIVPGIAFDKKSNRLGRGKGFYDRLLNTTQAYKIGIGFSFQLIDKVPTETHDIPLNRIITA